MSSRLVYRTCAWWRHLVNAYGVISLVRLIAAVWQLLAWLNPVVTSCCAPVLIVVLSCVAACVYALCLWLSVVTLTDIKGKERFILFTLFVFL